MPARPKSRRDSADPPAKSPALDKPPNGAEEDDDVWEEVPEKRLRFVDVLSEIPNGDASNATELCLPDRGLTEIESLESCRSLKKLELKQNYITELSFLDMNHELCWLGLARNRLERISGLKNLSSLAVLDLSDNRIARLEGLSELAGLKALIAVRNHISKVEGLSPKKNPLLETLVLSHNRITECNLAPFPALKKISLAQNKLHGFPGMATLPQLTELRLNGNRITALSPDIARQPKLSILDVGNNLLQRADSLEPLRGLLWIKSLNLLGNSIASDIEKEPLQGLLESLQKLEILNNRRLPQAGEKVAKKKQRGRRKKNNWNSEWTDDAAHHNSRWGKENVQSYAASVKVHGRGFQGKRKLFDDDTFGNVSSKSEDKGGVEFPAKILKKKKVKKAELQNKSTGKTTMKKRKAPAETSCHGEFTTSRVSENTIPAKRKKKVIKKVLQ